VHQQLMSGLHEVQGHRPTHVPEPDESDLHAVLLASSRWVPRAARGRL
jgi:hypothetical protein